MTINEQIGALHCDGQGGWSCRMSHGGYGGRTKLPIDAEIVPVHDKITVISLPHACLASGLLEDAREGRPVNWLVLKELVDKKWGKSIKRFFADARTTGVSRDSANDAAKGFKGTVIGWNGALPENLCCNDGAFGMCPDMNVAVAILSRSVGDIFISSRDPEYSWDKLFGRMLEVDEDLCSAPDFKSDPWAKFEWDVN